MTCFRPLKAYRAPNGKIAFDSKRGYVDQPLELPCGVCLGCKKQRAESWAVRCVHESTRHKRSCFLTLTYSPQQLPVDRSLNHRHFQLFCKRLRRRKGPFRFFMCGEYGDENLRPHYHALIFGIDFFEDREVLGLGKTHMLYRSPTVDELWVDETGANRGFSSLGSVTFASAGYVARYCLKKASAVKTEQYRRTNLETGQTWYVKPEYVAMSRRPGIGQSWIEQWREEVYPSDEVVWEGRKFRPPRYYDSYLERVDSESLASVRARRRRRVEEHKEALHADRLDAKECIARTKLENFQRRRI